MRHATPHVQLTLRIAPALFDALLQAIVIHEAQTTHSISLNQWCIQALERAVKEP